MGLEGLPVSLTEVRKIALQCVCFGRAGEDGEGPDPPHPAVRAAGAGAEGGQGEELRGESEARRRCVGWIPDEPE